MKTISQYLDQLQKLKTSVASTLAAASRVAAKLDADVQKLKDDRNMDADARARQTRVLQAAAQAAIAGYVRAINADKTVAVDLKPRLTTELLLAAVQDDTGGQRIAECMALPSRALQGRADAALADADLVEIKACWLASQGRAGTPGWSGFSLSGNVTIPGQATALQAIADIVAAGSAAEGLYKDAGTVSTGLTRPGRRLAQGHAQQALQRAPRPSSPGRPPLPPLAS